MATQMIKTTYALDVETVRALEDLARRWKVSKSEADDGAFVLGRERGSRASCGARAWAATA